MDKVQRDTDAVSDVELFERMAQKEEWALSVLYDRHAPRLYGLALKILKDQNLAEDALQELMLYLWEYAEKYDPSRGNPAAWMMILCRNRCIDKLRTRSKNVKRSAVIDEETSQKALTGESENPLDIVHKEEMQKIMQQAMRSLPDEQKALIEMAYFEGLSQSEISKQLNLPLGTVKTRIRLGMQKLRESIKQNLSR